MLKSFVVLWTFFSLISCYKGQRDSGSNANRNNTESIPKVDKKPEDGSCDTRLSHSLEGLRAYLSMDHTFEYIEMQKDLEFVDYDVDMVEKNSLMLGISEYHIFRIKSKNAIPGLESRYYPSFNVTVFCILAPEQDLVKAEQSINNIIHSKDPVNDKLYDQLIRSGNMFLYTSTMSKMFESYMESRRMDFVNILDEQLDEES